MKFAVFLSVPLAFIASVPFAGAIPTHRSSSALTRESRYTSGSINNVRAHDDRRAVQYGRSLTDILEAREFLDELAEELYRRGSMSSTLNGLKSKGKPGFKPETPKGEFRPFVAGKKDDYFGGWEKMAGVHNPAAGKGKPTGQAAPQKKSPHTVLGTSRPFELQQPPPPRAGKKKY